jgi:hypothetical protein
MAAMQDTKKEKEIALEHANQLRAEVEPLRSAVKKLRTAFGVARNAAGGDGTGSGSAEDSEEAAVEQEIRSMCMWYSEVNALIAGVSGVSMDTAESFGATTARINIHGCDHTLSEAADSANGVTALVVHFEPDTTRVAAAELDPPLAPISDVVAATKSERQTAGGDNYFHSTLMCLIREARARISGAARRKAEFDALQKRYIVQWNFGGKTRNSEPAASAWLYVRVTIPGGIVVEMRTAPDYPQPYTRIDVVQVCGVMGWNREDEIRLQTYAQSLNLSSISTMVDLIAKQLRKD